VAPSDPSPDGSLWQEPFPALKDKADLAFLNQQPTTFVLSDEAVDRLRAAAGTIIADSPESSGCCGKSARQWSCRHPPLNLDPLTHAW